MILALDLGSRFTGWARSDLTCGTWEAPRDACHGQILAAWCDWIAAALDGGPHAALVLEQPVFAPTQASRLVLGMHGIANMEAWCRDVPRFEHMASQVRRWLIGYAQVSPKDMPRKADRVRQIDAAVRQAVEERGFRPDTEHAADAAALLCRAEMRAPLELAA